MDKINDFKSVEYAVVRISCGSKSGTAFFINSADDRQILFTSHHTLSDSKNSKTYIQSGNGQQFDASILLHLPDQDVSIIEVDSFPETHTTLPLQSELIAYSAEWETFGYPAERINAGARFNGSISRTNEGTKWDIDLECSQYNNLADFEGLSGSPLIVEGFVAGIIGYDISGGLGATSIISIEEELLKLGIKVFKNNPSSIPFSIDDELPFTTPNTEVIDKIEETISSRIDSSYFILTGNPGSGKTTIAAQLEFSIEKFVICDRYFVKVPEQESIPTEIRATPDYFLKWIEEVYSRILYNRPPDKPKENEKPYERLLKIKEGLSLLGTYYKSKEKTGFIIIDGLDDVSEASREDFLSILPPRLSEGLRILFSCTSKSVLSSSMQSEITLEDEIKVTPLAIEKAERYLNEQLEGRNIPLSKIQELAAKSEGHPLYMRYLAKYVNGLKDISLLDNWIETIPVIHGEIQKYYNKIWQQIENGSNELWLAGTLSRLRIPIENDQLYGLLPKSTQESFPIALRKIQHLLKEDQRLSIYHTSFSDFVNSKTTAIAKDIHDNVANYCVENEASFLTISEQIYHLSKGNNKKRALHLCSQDWVDKCALFSVNPDIVLADIRRIISIAAAEGIAHKVIELLLLSQRVNFRYNILFDENATYLVNALLALGKFDEALRYVVRNNTVVVGDSDALYLLQRFYEYGADYQAEALLKAIKGICTAIYENGFDTESFNRYIKLRFSTISLTSNADFKGAYGEFDHLKGIVIRLIQESGNPEDAVHKFKDDVGSYNIGYYIWRFNVPPLTKEVEEQGLYNFDNKSSGFTALSIYQAINFRELSPIEKEEDNIATWVADLEYQIDTYGVHEDYYLPILFVLIRYSDNADIIDRLFKDLFQDTPSSSFRKENGVDFSRLSADRFLLHSECRGFLNGNDPFPKLVPYTNANWEDAIASRFEFLGFLTGRARRLYKTPDASLMYPLQERMSEFLISLSPDLGQRIDWKRSYGLPENIFPVLYDKVVEVLIEFFPDQIGSFIQNIKDKKNYQLGIYTEGYTDGLLWMARRFAKSFAYYEEAYQIAKTLEYHVLNTVENRWERNEYLLRLVQLYAQIENVDKANEMFSEMIDFSMGPSWYKEAQLGIINTAVSNILPRRGGLESLQKFASHLHHASGEMTFQRYVKQQQEEFVNDLSKAGFLSRAISYFKYLLLPDYTTIIDNAESSLIDMPRKGQGYVLGARAIEEQSGILNLLSGIDVGSSCIAYALTELFLIGDERYIPGFVRIQAKILIESVDTTLGGPLPIIKRIVRFYIAELSEEFRNDYLRELTKHVNSDILLTLQQEFAKADVKINLDDFKSVNEEKTSANLNTLDTLPNIKELAESRLRSDNKSAARGIVIEALENVQKEKYGIWPTYNSSNINDLVNILSETYNSSAELIKDIQKLIINEVNHEEWVIANRLIGLLRNINDDEERQKILDAVEQHIYLMVRTPNVTLDRYAFLGNDGENNEEVDTLLLELISWFLNHPSLVIKNRTIEILTWLSIQQPTIVLRSLVEEILTDGYKLSKELSAAIIHQVADAIPETFYPVFEKLLQEKGEQLLKVHHFMIQNTLIDALYTIKERTDFDPVYWIEKFEQFFKEKKGLNGDVEFEEEYIRSFESELYHLNELGLLSRKFAVDFLKLIEDSCPIAISDCLKANYYIDRSFNNFNEVQLVSDFENIVRFALNTSISPQVPLPERHKVADILRFYQPTFPENILTNQGLEEYGIGKSLKSLFSGNFEEVNNILNDDNTILGFYDKRFSRTENDYDEIELVAYLVAIENFHKGDHRFSWHTYRSNGYPENIPTSKNNGIIPMVITSDHSVLVTGSEVVPSYPNISFFQEFNFVASEMPKRNYWRNGRNWEQKQQGTSEQTGYSIKIPKQVIQRFKGKYKLIWDIDYNFQTIKFDVFDKKIIGQ